MLENEFEKQVKSTIEGFRLRPSEPVWPNIREEIRDKKRRRILLLIPVMAVLLGLGYFSWQSFYNTGRGHSQKDLLQNNITKNKDIHSKSPPQQQDIKKPENDSVITVKEGGQSLGDPASQNIGERDDKTDDKTGVPKETLREGLTAKGKPGKKGAIAIAKEKQMIDDLTHEKKDVLQPRLQKIRKDNLSDRTQKTQLVYSSIDEPPTVSKLSPDRTAVATEGGLPFRITGNLIARNNFVLKEVPPAKPAQPLARMGKIRWGIDVSVGVASRVDHPLQFASKERSSPSASSFFGNPVNTGTTGNVAGGGLLVLPPSAVSAGAGFKIGLAVDKPISKGIDVSTGIQYVYTSDRITIGKSIYSGNNLTLQDRNFYAASAVAQTSYSGLQGQIYTNKYHFVELPVTVHFNLNKRWKVPVIWNIGAAASRLISSNVLLYDETWGGLYYKGKNDLAKTQFSLATGFSFRFNGRNGWQWNLGPQVSMNTTELFRNTTDKNKHIVYGGLNLQLLLPGKKR